MEAILTENEIEAISKKVSNLLYDKFVASESHKELQGACEKYTKQYIGFYLSENAISYDAAKIIEPIIEKHLKKTRVVEEHLRSYMNTEHFKKLELKNLKQRVAQLESELDDERLTDEA